MTAVVIVVKDSEGQDNRTGEGRGEVTPPWYPRLPISSEEDNERTPQTTFFLSGTRCRLASTTPRQRGRRAYVRTGLCVPGALAGDPLL